MGDLTKKQNSSVVGITGPDEDVCADVATDTDGINKLAVKSSAVPTALGNLFFIEAMDGASPDMNVNGSGTPVEFTVDAESGVGAMDLVVQELRFVAFDNGIKIDNFLAQNSPLTNGVDIEVTSDGTTFNFMSVKNTSEFDSHFSYGPGGKFDIIVGSGDDYMSATFSPANPFVLKKDTADEIKVTINDNLNSVAELHMLAFGFKQ